MVDDASTEVYLPAMDATQTSVLSADGLRRLEDLLRETGADQSLLHQTQQKPPKPKRVSSANSSRQKDCLSQEPRDPQVSVISFATSRRSPSPSMVRGAVMCGKQGSDLMYIGKDFKMPPRDSPGPIYQPISTLDTTHGVSFTKAQRMAGSENSSVSPGPDLALPSTIGKQNLSEFSNLPNVVFSKAKRFNPREFISKAHEKGASSLDSPAPTAYQSLKSTNDGRGISFGKAPSRDKSVDADPSTTSATTHQQSPGPIYFEEDAIVQRCKETHKPVPVFIAHKSHYSSAPSISFAGKRHFVSNDDAVSEVSTVRPMASTPGPGNYNPKTDIVDRTAPSISFPKTKYRRAHSASPMGAGPGNPEHSLAYLDKHQSAVSFGDVHQQYNRFNDKIFLGRGIDNSMGSASPGPKYGPPELAKGPSVTMVFKERTVQNKLQPGPDRVRFISQELARENLGVHSPGPKYMLGDHPRWERAPAHSFGVSDRYFVDTNFSQEHRAKFGTAEKPYTSPGEARFVSLAHSRSAMSGKASPGPVGNPSIEHTSQYRKPVAVGISPPPPKPARFIPDNGNPPTRYYPSYNHVDMDQHVHSFGKAPRMEPSKASTLPGPGQYKIKYTQVEIDPPEVTIGIL